MKFTPPANAPTTDLLTTLAESYLERLRRGENPSMDEYAGQHPQLASEIRELFNTLRLVDELGEKSQFGGTLTTAVDPIPTRLGDFQLIREIARGGMGIVYDAVQTQLGRRVAVKVLPPAHGSDTSRRIRFRHEARAAANLHHSNIVPVFDVGEEQGISYYSMQYIEGETLAEVWRELHKCNHQVSLWDPRTDMVVNQLWPRRSVRAFWETRRRRTSALTTRPPWPLK